LLATTTTETDDDNGTVVEDMIPHHSGFYISVFYVSPLTGSNGKKEVTNQNTLVTVLLFNIALTYHIDGVLLSNDHKQSTSNAAFAKALHTER
jgi:hypothetical protein